MPESRHWKTLKREVGILRKHFLPDPFDPLGTYPNSQRVQAHTRAFVVLSHAEIESYLELWAKEVARASETAWTTSGKITEPFAYLVATLSDRILVPETVTGHGTKDSRQRFLEASTKVFQTYYKQIKDNNGIKEKNVLTLFAPLGIPAASFGSTLLPNLDNLGALRGVHAHHSAKAVQNVLDPETEHNRVTSVVAELLVLDGWLTSCKRRIR